MMFLDVARGIRKPLRAREMGEIGPVWGASGDCERHLPHAQDLPITGLTAPAPAVARAQI